MRRFNLQILFILLLLSTTFTSCIANNPITYSRTIEVTITDENYSPNSWTVPSGEMIIIDVQNNGSSDHNWSLIGWPVSTPFDKDDLEKIVFQAHVKPAESKQFSFTSPNGPGEYEIVSIIDNRIEDGFLGKLIVIHEDEIFSQPSE